MEKRGQVAIFVIVAMVIIIGVIAFVAYPSVKVFVGDVNPQVYLRDCVEKDLNSILQKVTMQGGNVQPDNYLTYQDSQIQYLCYTSEFYKPCVVQQPLLVRHVENEIASALMPKAEQCVTSLKELYDRKGYKVSGAVEEVNASFVPGTFEIIIYAPLTIAKDNVQTFQSFSISRSSQMYDLLITATDIVHSESIVGDSETLTYINYYPNLKIEKTKYGSDTIYKLSNVVSDESFTFASRSLVWPEGYGIGV